MTYQPSIAERIAWTTGLGPTDAKVLQAVASCGDWMTGRNCRAGVKTYVERSNLARATVTRALARLREDGWIRPTSQRHRHVTHYDIQVDRLAAAPPKEQQMHIETVLDGPPRFEAQIEPQDRFEAQVEPQPPDLRLNLSLHLNPDLDLEERTHTPRAREAAALTTDLALLGAVPPVKCAHPNAHAWCDGRVHVPRDLHFEFLDRLDTRPGERPSAKAGRLIAFYAATLAAIPATQAIGQDAYKFWKQAFATWVERSAPGAPPTVRLTAREIEEAKTIRDRAYAMRCPHDPCCASSADCVRAIAVARKVAVS